MLENYSFEEQNTGEKWVDGKSIYRKTFNIGKIAGNGIKSERVSHPHNIGGLEKIIKYEGFAQGGIPIVGGDGSQAAAPLPYPGGNLSELVNDPLSFFVKPTTIDVSVSAHMRKLDFCHITLYYTCTNR